MRFNTTLFKQNFFHEFLNCKSVRYGCKLRVMAYMGFKNLVAKLKGQGKIKNPAALAAAIGRKKYGKKKFQKAASTGRKLG